MNDIVEEIKMDLKGRPIEVFETQESLDICLKWWQEKLLLNDWIIKARMVLKSEMINEDAQGENSFIHERKAAVIRILKKEEMESDTVSNRTLRHCDEQILVHELLHCLYDWMSPSSGTYEAVYHEEMEHQRLDSLAKTLIMVKYNLPLSYFEKNE